MLVVVTHVRSVRRALRNARQRHEDGSVQWPGTAALLALMEPGAIPSQRFGATNDADVQFERTEPLGACRDGPGDDFAGTGNVAGRAEWHAPCELLVADRPTGDSRVAGERATSESGRATSGTGRATSGTGRTMRTNARRRPHR